MAEDRGDRFQADWLSLREPVDHRSRHGSLTAILARCGEARGWSRVLDLGGGTGSNVRYLAPRLPWARTWRVVDHDPALLARIEPPPGATLETVEGDLAREGLASVAQADLVTASALLDLVSRGWLEALGERCARRGCAVLLALTYDGTVRLDGEAPDPDDAFVVAAVNRHQMGNKGLGRALGPGAASAALHVFRAAGYHARLSPSPWVLEGPADAPLALALMEGWVEAAGALHPAESGRLEAWLSRRGAEFREGRLRVTVGHQDLLALPFPWKPATPEGGHGAPGA